MIADVREYVSFLCILKSCSVNRRSDGEERRCIGNTRECRARRCRSAAPQQMLELLITFRFLATWPEWLYLPKDQIATDLYFLIALSLADVSCHNSRIWGQAESGSSGFGFTSWLETEILSAESSLTVESGVLSISITGVISRNHPLRRFITCPRNNHMSCDIKLLNGKRVAEIPCTQPCQT